MHQLAAARREDGAGRNELERRVEKVEDEPPARLEVRPERGEGRALGVGGQEELEDARRRDDELESAAEVERRLVALDEG